jgi:hypothetical protein
MNVWCAKIEIMTLFRAWASRDIARYRISHLSGWNHQFDQIMCVCLLYMDILQRLRVQVCDRNVNLPCGDVRAAVIVDFWDARAVIDSTRRSVRIGTFLEYANYVRIEIYHEGYIVWLYLQFQCCSCSNKRMLSKNWNRDSFPCTRFLMELQNSNFLTECPKSWFWWVHTWVSFVHGHIAAFVSLSYRIWTWICLVETQGQRQKSMPEARAPS